MKECKELIYHRLKNILADDINRTLILEQVELGVAIRMSVIEHLINNLDNKKFDIINEK